MEEKWEKEKEALQDQITNIRDNHLKHLATAMTDIKIKQATHTTDLDWLKKAFWVVLTASVGSFLASLFNLIS